MHIESRHRFILHQPGPGWDLRTSTPLHHKICPSEAASRHHHTIHIRYLRGPGCGGEGKHYQYDNVFWNAAE